MEVMVKTCCGIDVHQKTIVCCILDGPFETNRPKKIHKTFGTTTQELRKAQEWLLDYQVTHVFMESTGQYWVPVYNILHHDNLELILANPAHIKNVPGRKTDTNDAEWLAQLGRFGLIRASFLPCSESLELRLLTRKRTSINQKLTQCKNEIHNILQRANIKLTTYLSDVFGKSGQALLNLFINGEVVDLSSVKRCIHGKVIATPEDILKALDGKMSRVDCRILDLSLKEYNLFVEEIEILNKLIEEFILENFPKEYDLLLAIPGLSKYGAAVILAEIGPNVETFKTSAQLASWAGVAPGSYESAGVKYGSRITHGNKYLKRILVLCGGIAGRSNDLVFSSLYNRISNRGSKMKAIVACAHKLLRIIYKILSCKVNYNIGEASTLQPQN